MRGHPLPILPVYVDMDDVLSDTTRIQVDILSSEFKKSADYDSIASFDLKESFGLSDDEYSREDSPAMADYLSNTMKVPVALMDRP